MNELETNLKVIKDLNAIDADFHLSNALKIRAVTNLFFSVKPTSMQVVGRMMLMMEQYATEIATGH